MDWASRKKNTGEATVGGDGATNWPLDDKRNSEILLYWLSQIEVIKPLLGPGLCPAQLELIFPHIYRVQTSSILSLMLGP